MNTLSLRLLAALAAFATASLAVPPPSPPVIYTPIAVTGGQAGGLPAGVIFTDLSAPVLNGFGSFAFRGMVTGTGVTADNDEAIFISEPDGDGVAAQEGEAAPTGGADHVFASFSPILVLTVEGDVFFVAKIRGTGVTAANDEVFCVATANGDIELIAREGDAVPGAAHTFAPGAFDPAANASFVPFGQGGGWGAFYGKLALSGGGTGDGVFVFDGATLHSAALPGMAVPDVSGATFGRVTGGSVPSLQPLALAPSGRVTYHANFALPGGSSADGFFVFDPASGVSRRVGAITDGTASGLGRDRSFGPVEMAVANGGDAILGSSWLRRTSTGEDLFNEIVLARHPVDLLSGTAADPKPTAVPRPNIVARRDQQAPSTSPRTRYSAFLKLALNRFRAAAFHAQLFKENIQPSQDEGLFLAKGPAGRPALVARKGFQAPGLDSGVMIDSFQNFSLNNAGQLLHEVKLTGTGVQAGVNDCVLGLRTVEGTRVTHQTIVRTGQQIEVAPGDMRTVASFDQARPARTGSGHDGLPRTLSDEGSAGILVGFTGGSKAIFDGSGVKVPIYQPDIIVKIIPTDPFLGSDIYDKKHKEQNPTAQVPTPPSGMANVTATTLINVRVQNDGSVDDTIIFDGGKKNTFYIYYDENNTNLVLPDPTLGIEFPLKPGEFKDFVIRYDISRDAEKSLRLKGAPRDIKLLAKSKADPRKTDAFRIAIKININ